VLSPVLCNVYLHRLDRAWRGAYGTLVRYADDGAPRALKEVRCRRSDRSDAVLHWRWRLALRDRPAGGGLKPPQAAPVNEPGW
jgi:hypothetical protein